MAPYAAPTPRRSKGTGLVVGVVVAAIVVVGGGVAAIIAVTSGGGSSSAGTAVTVPATATPTTGGEQRSKVDTARVNSLKTLLGQNTPKSGDKPIDITTCPVAVDADASRVLQSVLDQGATPDSSTASVALDDTIERGLVFLYCEFDFKTTVGIHKAGTDAPPFFVGYSAYVDPELDTQGYYRAQATRDKGRYESRPGGPRSLAGGASLGGHCVVDTSDGTRSFCTYVWRKGSLNLELLLPPDIPADTAFAAMQKAVPHMLSALDNLNGD